jgi:hypothetical protein
MQAPERLRKQAQGGSEEIALQRALTRVPERRDQELIGQPAAVSGQQDESVSLEDEALSRVPLRLQVTADGADPAVFLGLDRRRCFLEPSELSVAVRKARAGLASLVQERMDVRKARVARGSRPLAPGNRDPVDLVVVQLGEGANVPGCRDDDLVMLEDGIEVGDDSNRPARRVRGATARTDREGFRRCPLLPPFAERAGDQLFLGREVEVRSRTRARSLRSARRDDDPLPGDRVLAKLPARGQLEDPPPFFFLSMNGLSRSIGAGKTIVVDCEDPSSSSVCR